MRPAQRVICFGSMARAESAAAIAASSLPASNSASARPASQGLVAAHAPFRFDRCRHHCRLARPQLPYHDRSSVQSRPSDDHRTEPVALHIRHRVLLELAQIPEDALGRRERRAAGCHQLLVLRQLTCALASHLKVVEQHPALRIERVISDPVLAISPIELQQHADRHFGGIKQFRNQIVGRRAQ